MTVPNNLAMQINESQITVTKINGEDYICLTDMAKAYGAEKVVENWLRNKNTLEFLGVWERLNNADFNSLEFEGIKNQAGLNRFTISAKQWIAAVNARGIVARAGRYGGTYAQKDIAFEFGTWLSPEFKLLVITEFQRLKAKEEKLIEWDTHRYLSKINYRIHTDSIKNILLPALSLSKPLETYVYTDEADMLNKIVFGSTAAEWRKANPDLAKKSKNQRDGATVHQLVLMANLQSLNAHFVAEGKDQPERVRLLIAEARRQYETLLKQQDEQDKLDAGGSKNA